MLNSKKFTDSGFTVKDGIVSVPEKTGITMTRDAVPIPGEERMQSFRLLIVFA
jgi:hypothetical protein